MTLSAKDTAPQSARAHMRAIATLGLPLIGSHLAQVAVQATDTLMLGWYDVTALAALAIAGALYFVLFIVGSGFAWAVMPMVASHAGTGDETQIRRVTRMGLWLSCMYGVVLTPVLIWSEPLFLAMGQEPEVAREAGIYLSIVAWTLIPNLVIMVLKSYLSALERTRIILVVTLAVALLNAVINYALIFGHWGAPEMGIRGAAIGSLVTTFLGMIWLALYAIRAFPETELFRNPHRPDWEAFAQVFRLGWPIGITNLAEVGLFAASSFLVGWVGTLELAAHGIAIQIASITFMVHVGLSQTATVRAGRAYGRRDEASLRRGALVIMEMSMAMVVLTMAAFLLFPDFLIGLFLSPDDPDRVAILAIGAVLLGLAALFQLMDAAQVMSLGLLRGVQDTRVPMVMATVSYWVVGAPASYILAFPLGLGAPGVWLGLVVGLAAAGMLLSLRFWTRSARIGGAGVPA